jgi:tRNA-Thr(GGU) m(6)t(6)A37 methyltransferase TsaA
MVTVATAAAKLPIALALAFGALAALGGLAHAGEAVPMAGGSAVYEVRPIGWVRKTADKTTIELEPAYAPGLLGVDALEEIWVLWWLDRNDTPRQRAILQVHPRGNPANALRGVFATRAPMRPNLIAMTRCRVLSVDGNVIEIDGIDAYADTPVLDLKP